ncbi:endo alpha-1,4 polygalactosaminidase [Hydrogenibacillus sp. N12]|nr:endo alpha-1,4 polygalactosaminidase [Hydrogenibacillus sp. N12]
MKTEKRHSRSPLRRHIQFTGALSVPRDAERVMLDLFETDASTVARLKREGKRVIGYLNAGAWEDWRPDADRYPKTVLGKDVADWPGERWIDIRRLDLLGPILQDRFDLCLAKGFHGLDPDNLNVSKRHRISPLRRRSAPLQSLGRLGSASSRPDRRS